MDRQTACLQGGRLWGECLSDQPSAGGSQAGLLHAVTTSMCATWRSQYSASPICAQAEMTAIAKLCDNYVAWQQPAICSQVGRRAGPVAVLRPPLKALALGRAVDVDGAPDAAAALVQPLPRRRVLLQRTRHHVHVVSLCCPGSHRKQSSVTITTTQPIAAAMAALYLAPRLPVDVVRGPRSNGPVPVTVPAPQNHQEHSAHAWCSGRVADDRCVCMLCM